jgi:hypothetical protein
MGAGRRLAMVSLAALVPQSVALANDAPTPFEYLTGVLDAVEQQAYYADRIDWARWRADAAAEAATARRTADTCDFVRRLLLELGDHHSGSSHPHK